MRIGIVVVEFPSYSETFFINKIIGLCERGHEVIVFRVNKPQSIGSTELEEFKKYKNLSIVSFDFNLSVYEWAKTVTKYPVVWIKNFSINFNSYKKNVYYNLCALYFKRYNCDVFHFGYSGLAVYYYSLLNNLGSKVMVSCLGTAEKVKALADTSRKEKLELVFKKVDSIHCVSADMAATVKKYGAEQYKIYINRPAIDEVFFSRKNAYRKNETVKIISVGRLVFQKGFVLGLKAIHELSKRFENFTWTIAGAGSDLEEMIFHISSLKLEGKVNLLGKKTKEEIYTLYADADIFFLPSVCEGIANVALEAMAMQIPVVSSMTGGMTEAITHDIDGLLFRNYDCNAMTEQLFELCNDFEKRKRLGINARQTVEKHFTLKRYIDVFENEYYKLTGQ